ncbi:hypothetical protein COO91_06855 [Nostoc flagelliforme CCNUN1]|uniref:Uncharacterized protein n=1 Tax=Nostoc flagelliforme CCNUN1 TaxID=2038116 RepID=A0A2K8SZG4_9NOSO|nr:hypothetical protein [Nostoc flagelliforme]AUB40826.1 hypothetical protein COO91_06855 [Nostoc flagelliforme CCNUN1]
MNDEEKKSFDFLSETTKQLLTLSTGIITFTVTFTKDIIGSVTVFNFLLLKIAWLSYLLSIVAGILTLLSLTATLSKAGNIKNTTTPKKYSIYDSNIRIFSYVQVLSFILATGLTIGFGWMSIDKPAKPINQNQSLPNISPIKPTTPTKTSSP